jgi:mono/diheme cytochrome c family protein
MKRISGLAALAALLVVGPAAFAQQPGRGGAAATTGAQRTTGDSIGPYNKQIVDPVAADRGRHLYATECVDCHGPTARGVDNQGPNLIRSEVVLHDRVGSELGPFLKKGHPMQSKTSAASLTDNQIADLSHFLKQRVDDALKRQPMGDHINIISGDAAAGKAYFEGAGKCTTCHSLTGTQPGSLARIGARYADPVDLQQAMMFPSGRGGRGGAGRGAGRGGPVAAGTAPVMLTVTPAGGQPIRGELVFLDDFDAQLRDSSGKLHSFTRTPTLKVVKTDPLQAHHELLDTMTDKTMHDLVVYLETVK